MRAGSSLARVPGALKEGIPLAFFNIHSIAKRQKNGKSPLEKTFFEKKSQRRKKRLKGGTLSLSRYCMLRGKKEKPLWFSSPGQMIHFDTIKFRRAL